MFWNNVVLLGVAALLCWLCGKGTFFGVYVFTLSLAGGLGIVLFTVQHNFEHSYASATALWDYDTGAMEGTSFLVLPRWLNWFTLNIGYHHIHHLNARIPFYRLPEVFTKIPELKTPKTTSLHPFDIIRCLRLKVWDTDAQQMVSLRNI